MKFTARFSLASIVTSVLLAMTSASVASSQSGADVSRVPEASSVLAEGISRELAKAIHRKGNGQSVSKQDIESFSRDLLARLRSTGANSGDASAQQAEIRRFCEGGADSNKLICSQLSASGKPAEAILIGLLLPAVQKVR